MSKQEGPHEAVKQAVMPEPGKPSSRLQIATQWVTFLSFFFVVMTPITYFIGRAYHDGWYDALNLDGGLFPLDTAAMLTQGFVVAGDGLAKLAVAIVHALGMHFILLLSVVLTAALTWATCKWLGHRADERSASKPKKPTQDQSVRQRSLRYLTVNSILVVLIGLFGIYELVFVLTLGYLVVTQPFYQLGKYEAQEKAATDFEKSSMVTVKTSAGDVKFRELGCGPQFCALWGNKHASFAPVSAITWGDTQAPGK